MFRTHLTFALMLGLIFIGFVDNKILFIPIVLIASLMPDIDSTKSFIGNRWYFRPMQWFMKHRGMLHSLSFCILASLGISFLFPESAFPFFLGYSSHLMGDAITKEGIRPLWPFEGEIRGRIRTGGRVEVIALLSLVVINLCLLAFIFKRFFIS